MNISGQFVWTWRTSQGDPIICVEIYIKDEEKEMWKKAPVKWNESIRVIKKYVFIQAPFEHKRKKD